MEPKKIFEDDGWICLNADEKKRVNKVRLKTKKKKLTCQFWSPGKKGMG